MDYVNSKITNVAYHSEASANTYETVHSFTAAGVQSTIFVTVRPFYASGRPDGLKVVDTTNGVTLASVESSTYTEVFLAVPLAVQEGHTAAIQERRAGVGLHDGAIMLIRA